MMITYGIEDLHDMSIEELADSLLGTCHDFNANGFSVEQLQEFDDIIFNCNICGYWHDVMERNEDDVCTDCFEEEE